MVDLSFLTMHFNDTSHHCARCRHEMDVPEVIGVGICSRPRLIRGTMVDAPVSDLMMRCSQCGLQQHFYDPFTTHAALMLMKPVHAELVSRVYRQLGEREPTPSEREARASRELRRLTAMLHAARQPKEPRR